MSTILATIEAFLDRNREVSASYMGLAALNDRSFVTQLRGKRQSHPRQSTADTETVVRLWMETYEAHKAQGPRAASEAASVAAMAHSARLKLERAAALAAKAEQDAAAARERLNQARAQFAQFERVCAA